MEDKINAWKDQWETGYTKFVPELFDLLQALYKELDQVKAAYEDRLDDIESLEKSLRDIDNHIRSTDEPVEHIVKVLKDSLPEYHVDF